VVLENQLDLVRKPENAREMWQVGVQQNETFCILASCGGTVSTHSILSLTTTNKDT
jgi:hypothetical protein